ncbi:MAG TPA: peptidyl-prolyl cis-trans isomerase [Thermoanaerobaculia bacterium]|nr:peptidyl-prolyl cis-trans isomerase [Thermoanaerobaculia bacterium]
MTPDAERHGTSWRRLLPSLCLVLIGLAAPAQLAADVVNRIVLRINARIATLIDFEQALADRRQAILQSPDLEPGRRQELLAEAGRRVFADLYEELLLLSRADQLGIRVSDADVAEAMSRTKQRMGIETDEQFHQALAAAGIGEDQLRQRLRRNLLVQHVMSREVQSRIQVEEEDLRLYYQQHPDEFVVPPARHLLEIIVLVEGIQEQQERSAAAAEIVRELRAGATLDAVVEKSGGLTSGIIDLGWVERGDLDPALAEAAWALEPGEVSEPVPGRGGLHVLQLIERREESRRRFEEVRETLLAQEQERRMGGEYRKYLEELEQRAFVKLEPPPEAAGFTGIVEEPESPGEELLEEPLGEG